MLKCTSYIKRGLKPIKTNKKRCMYACTCVRTHMDTHSPHCILGHMMTKQCNRRWGTSVEACFFALVNPLGNDWRCSSVGWSCSILNCCSKIQDSEEMQCENLDRMDTLFKVIYGSILYLVFKALLPGWARQFSSSNLVPAYQWIILILVSVS